MSELRLRGGAAALALAIAAGAGIVACGDDGEPTAGSTETTSEQTAQPSSTTTTTTDEEVPTEVADEGHEGGGPDPGTEEAEAAQDLAEEPEEVAEPEDDAHSGGAEAGGDEREPADSGGASPTDAFDEFCEQNPSACE